MLKAKQNFRLYNSWLFGFETLDNTIRVSPNYCTFLEYLQLRMSAQPWGICRAERLRFQPRSDQQLFVSPFHLVQYQFAPLFGI